VPAENQPTDKPIGVGIVGIGPDAVSRIQDELPDGFELVAFSDEGLEGAGTHDRPITYHGDFNMMLRDEHVELVLVDGPVGLRRDMAVRALNGGCHVLMRPPFCESAADAERVAKTALRNGLVATMNVAWGDDADLRAPSASGPRRSPRRARRPSACWRCWARRSSTRCGC